VEAHEELRLVAVGEVGPGFERQGPVLAAGHDDLVAAEDELLLQQERERQREDLLLATKGLEADRAGIGSAVAGIHADLHRDPMLGVVREAGQPRASGVRAGSSIRQGIVLHIVMRNATILQCIM
jgi:hypothetical protein